MTPAPGPDGPPGQDGPTVILVSLAHWLLTCWDHMIVFPDAWQLRDHLIAHHSAPPDLAAPVIVETEQQ